MDYDFTNLEAQQKADIEKYFDKIDRLSKADLAKQCELDDKRTKAYEILFSKQDIIAKAVFHAFSMKNKKNSKLGKFVTKNNPIVHIKTIPTRERLEAEFKTANDYFDIHLYENENKYSFTIFFYKGVDYYFEMRDFFCFSRDAALVKIIQILSYALNDDFSIRDKSQLRLIRKKLKKIENSIAKLEIKLGGLGDEHDEFGGKNDK